jgi:hypothetical protein
MLVIAGGSGSWLNRQLLSTRVIVFVGLVSYPWYLWHWPALSLARLVRPDLSWVGVAVAVGVSFLLAVGTYLFVERPMRRIPPRVVRTPLLLCLVLLAGAGFASAHGLLGPAIPRAYPLVDAASVDGEYSKGGVVSAPGPGLDAVSFGAAAPQRTVLFIGDSHAEQYMPRVERLGDSLSRLGTKVSFVTRSGCPPMPDVDRLQSSIRCGSFARDAFSVARAPSVSTVVLAGYWEGYFLPAFDDARRREPALVPVYFADDPARRPIRLASADRLRLQRALEREVGELRAAGKRVVLLASNPAARQFAPREMIDRLSLRWIPRRAIESADYQRFLAPVDSLLRAVARSTGAEVLSPMGALCPEGRCSMLRDGESPIYLNRDHIRANTARQLPLLDAIVLARDTAGH